VESVAPHAVLFVEIQRQAVEPGVARQGGMERRVEHRDMRHRRKHTPRLADAGHVHRIVQRRERTQGFDASHHSVIDQYRAGEFLPAVHHAMPDSTDSGGFFDRSLLFVEQSRQHGSERLRIAALRQVALQLALPTVLHQLHAFLTDAVHVPAHRVPGQLRVEEAVLQRR
jgi:hypothetical protein